MTSLLVFLDTDPEDRAMVQQRFPEALVPDHALTGDELIEYCKNAEVISAFIHTAFTDAILEQLPRLRLLCTRSVGYDHIDVAACERRGITVCNVPDYGSHVIAEHVFALLLSTLRHVREADARVEKGEFDYHGLRGISLHGKTMGIVGTGKIGRKVAKIAHGFGMKILAVDKCRTVELQDAFGVSYVNFDELLRESDIITLHAPSTKDTYHMISSQSLVQVKKDCILVNTARGDLIDSSALLEALKRGKIRYALLDVLEHEKNFQENKELIGHPNVVVTPHIAFYAEDSMRNMFEDCFTSIEEWQSGNTPHHVVQLHAVVCDLPGVSVPSNEVEKRDK